jgi:hypothetical protein
MLWKTCGIAWRGVEEGPQALFRFNRLTDAAKTRTSPNHLSTRSFHQFSVCIGLRKQISQAIEPSCPQGSTIVDPAFRHCKSFRLNATRAHPPDLGGTHQSALFQHVQMLNHRGKSDVERFCQSRYGNGPLTELFNQGPARGIAQGVENAVDMGSAIHRGPCLSVSDYPAISLANCSNSWRHPASRI